jgi:DNA polymerase (family 10)/putative hydrolase
LKTWEKYQKLLDSGEWHIHTTYSDGFNVVDDYAKAAVELRIPLIAFTEHVRKDLNYDFNKFLSDIETANDRYDLIIFSGCEAKVLPDGNLDVDEWILKEVDYPIFAFHWFPVDRIKYLNALKTAIKNPYVNTWAHPGLFLRKNHFELTQDERNEIFQLMIDNKVLLEINRQYNLPLESWRMDLGKRKVQTVRGSDVHTVDHLEE